MSQALPRVGSAQLNAAGGVGALATASSVNTWYRDLRKPSWQPPGWLFGPGDHFHTLMGIASWLVSRSRSPRKNAPCASMDGSWGSTPSGRSSSSACAGPT